MFKDIQTTVATMEKQLTEEDKKQKDAARKKTIRKAAIEISKA